VLSLPALGTLLLAGALTTLVGDVRWGPFSVLPVAFACLSPLIVIPAVPVALVAIQRRRWATLVLPVSATALPWAFVVAYALPAHPPAGRTVPLRAMIVTAHDGSASAPDIVSAVRSQHTDVLIVTELSSRLAHDLTAAGLPETLTARYVSVPDPGMSPTAGIGIFSRFDTGPVTTFGATHWPAVTARVMVGRAVVTLVAGHAVQPSANHLDQWRHDLAAFGAAKRIKGPVLVLVNLNATPWNPQFRWILSGRLHDAADVLGRGLRPTWPSWTPVPLLPADHALVAGLGVTDQAALPIDGTDHRALSVGLAVPVAQ
jgi:endonuclease/exonuclease/phosphatase (EEP) superfamily protein YafD